MCGWLVLYKSFMCRSVSDTVDQTECENVQCTKKKETHNFQFCTEMHDFKRVLM